MRDPPFKTTIEKNNGQQAGVSWILRAPTKGELDASRLAAAARLVRAGALR
jgi:hypothetical protein